MAVGKREGYVRLFVAREHGIFLFMAAIVRKPMVWIGWNGR